MGNTNFDRSFPVTRPPPANIMSIHPRDMITGIPAAVNGSASATEVVRAGETDAHIAHAHRATRTMGWLDARRPASATTEIQWLGVGTHLDEWAGEHFRSRTHTRVPRMNKLTSSLMSALLIASSSLALTACNSQESPAEAQADVAEAQADGQQAVAEDAAEAAVVAAEGREDVAKSDDAAEAREAQADAIEDNADAQKDVAETKAKADYDVAVQKCDALPSAQQSACKDQAEATYDAAKAKADMSKEQKEGVADRVRQ